MWRAAVFAMALIMVGVSACDPTDPVPEQMELVSAAPGSPLVLAWASDSAWDPAETQPVTAWPNRGSLGGELTALTSSPDRLGWDAALNGHPSIRGGVDATLETSWTPTVQLPVTVIAYGTLEGPGSRRIGGGASPTGSARAAIGKTKSGNWVLHNGRALDSGIPADQEPHLFRAVFTNTGDSRLYIDEELVVTGDTGSPTAFGRFTSGALNASSTGALGLLGLWSGDVASEMPEAWDSYADTIQRHYSIPVPGLTPTPGPPDLVQDLISSWWSTPQAVLNDGSVYVGGISSTGMTRVAVIGADGQVVQHDLVSLPVDDHNTPALLIEDDLPPVVAVAGHSTHPWLSVLRGTKPGDVSDLGPEQRVEWGGINRSYAHLYRRPGTQTIKATTRGGPQSGWYTTTSQDAGATWGPETRAWPFGYVTYREGNDAGLVRCWLSEPCWWFATAGNPTSSGNDIRVWQVNQATGEVRDAQGKLAPVNWWEQTAPISASHVSVAVPPMQSPNRIRLLDVGPDGSLLVARWQDGDDGTVTYEVLLHLRAGEWISLGQTDGGLPFGYETSRYVGGARFDTGPTDVVLVREHTRRGAPGTWTLERWKDWRYEEILRVDDGRKLGRPIIPTGAEGTGLVLVQELDQYSMTGYKKWQSSIRLLRDT